MTIIQKLDIYFKMNTEQSPYPGEFKERATLCTLYSASPKGGRYVYTTALLR